MVTESGFARSRDPVCQGDMTSPLAHPVYRRLFAAQAIALFGSGLTTVALGLLA